jgi:hypothetical protein
MILVLALEIKRRCHLPHISGILYVLASRGLGDSNPSTLSKVVLSS